jgi:two-component system, chemotaxis family, protein-glutamate methylesterase/glutaminase
MPEKIKTLLIEDSGLMRILLSDHLRKDENITLLATAMNGLEGVEKAKALKPDVVITDMVMPQYDGLYVVQQLMREMPLPIILLSSLGREDRKIFDALREGAFDFIDKPEGGHISDRFDRLTQMVREASLTDYLKLKQRATSQNKLTHTFEARLNYDIIAVGASTGGPGAVEFFINNLPSNLTIPVVIAQHMPERFIESFSRRISESTGMKVSIMQDGEALMTDHIYLAPGNTNMRIVLEGSSPIARCTQSSYKEFNYPSIDCIFESIARVYGGRAIGVILTGMGKDGSAGLLQIRKAGGLTVAQDETSSVVYGMPKAALEAGAVRYTVPLHEIPSFLISAL